ncbi:MAG: hypothetical protein NVSMB19_08730 [Vulcanimicrobiaceae bacterium]
MRRNAQAVSLFEDRPGADFEAKIRAFAREVGKRHRGRPEDSRALVAALRGYYRTWSIVARLPPLDDRMLAIALAEYGFVRSGRRAKAA